MWRFSLRSKRLASRAEVDLETFPLYKPASQQLSPLLRARQQKRTNWVLARETTHHHLLKRPDRVGLPLYARGVHTTQQDRPVAKSGEKTSTMDVQDVLLMLYAVDRDEKWEHELLQRVPGKLRVRWENIRKPDGSIKAAHEHDPKLFEDVTMLFTYSPVPADAVPKLRFVQLSSAGSDLWQSHPKYLDSNVKFATTSGSNPPQIAEWVIGQWLKFQHHLSNYDENQKKHYWEPSLARQVEDSVGLRVGILGYGAIGRQVSRLCRALGMEVYAFTASPRTTPESRVLRGYNLPNIGDPQGELPARWFHGTSKEAVNDFLSQDLDMLVISLPLTKLSRKLIGEEQFRILGKKKAFVVNIARGPIVDQDALIQALEHGVIRGAALDVTDPEPLPADHPLWDAKNCAITPHVSWLSTHQTDRARDILADNVVRLFNGETLINELAHKARTHHED